MWQLETRPMESVSWASQLHGHGYTSTNPGELRALVRQKRWLLIQDDSRERKDQVRLP